MKKFYASISEALSVERPTDKIVKVLSNKFAIVESPFENGRYDKPKVCGIENNKIYFCGDPYVQGVWSLKLWIQNRLETLPNIQMQATSYYGGITLFRNANHHKYKQTYRKLLKLLP